MKKIIYLILSIMLPLTLPAQVSSTPENGYGLPGEIVMPEPDSSESVRRETKVVGWPKGKAPSVPEGFEVKRFAENLQHPRWIYVLPNGDVLVAESNDKGKQSSSTSADRITLLRDKNKDGEADERHVFLKNLNQPFGMALLNGYLYVANSDNLVRFTYQQGVNSISAKGEKMLALPAGGYNHHWTRNVMVDDTGKKLLITVGSSSNVGEHGMDKEERRANILIVNPDGSDEEVYAWGIRNPNGLDYNPETGELWTAVNERDKLGDNLVPDYITSVQKGGFYGWPYQYFGDHVDPRWRDSIPADLPKVIIPDFATGSHTATMDIEFYEGDAFPEKYKNGAFVGQHGSWNREIYSGYKVVFIPFENGKPTGETEDFMTGFMKDAEKDQAYGRPVAVAELENGSLLISDDDGNIIWSVRAK